MNAPATRAGKDELDAALAAILSRGRQNCIARVDELEEAVAALAESRLTEEWRSEAESAAHRLAGAAGTFGFHRVSEMARELEWALAGTEAISAQRIRRSIDELAIMRADLDRDPAPDRDGTPQAGGGAGPARD